MWIRSIRWKDRKNPERSFRGRYRPPLDSGEIDTSDLDAEKLSRRLPAAKYHLADHGDLILEVVLREGSKLPQDLKEILDVIVPGGEGTIASFIELERPIPTIYQSQIGSGGKQIWSVHMRAFVAPELGFDEQDGRKPRLVGRPVRTVDNGSLLLVFWRGVWAFPEMPSPRGDTVFQPAREFPGTIAPSGLIQKEIARGVPENLARFATEWGGVGPSSLDAAVAKFDEVDTIGPQGVAEDWFARLALNLREVSEEGLGSAFRAWDHDLLEQIKGVDPSLGEANRLVELGGMVTLLREAHHEMSEPFDHAVPYWFAGTEDSAEIEESLGVVKASLDHFETRLRDSLALASTVISSGLLQLQQRNQLRGERLQRAVTTIGALVLGPTLVAGVFGANVPLPLGETWWGFALMIVLALLSTALVYLLLNRLTREA